MARLDHSPGKAGPVVLVATDVAARGGDWLWPITNIHNARVTIRRYGLHISYIYISI